MIEPSEGLKNQRVAEYLVIAMIVGLGTPLCVLWGAGQGERLASKTQVVENPSAPMVVALDMFKATPENIERGQALFAKNCISCHGEKADGKGPAATALTPKPRDFTDPAAKWTMGREPREIFKSISEGVPGTGMVPFSFSLPEAERWALAHYLGTLPGVNGQFTPLDQALAGKPGPEKSP